MRKKSANRIIQQALMGGLAIILLSCGFFIEMISHFFAVSVLIYIIVNLGCIYIIRLEPRINDDMFDPGFLFLIFVLMNIVPISISFLVGSEVFEMGWYIADTFIFAKVILLHLILISSFTLIYILAGKGQKATYPEREDKKIGILRNNIWVYIWLVLAMFTFLYEIVSGTYYSRSVGGSHDMVSLLKTEHSLVGQQIFSRISNLEAIASVFGLGVLVCRARNLMKARITLFIVTGLLFSWSFIMHASRGIAIILISAGAYADIVRWRGKLFNWKLFLFIVIGGWITMHAVNILEVFFITGGTIETSERLFTSLEPRIIENAGVITAMVDSSSLSIQYGNNYLSALKSLLPTQILGEKIESLPEWFVWTFYPRVAESGTAFAFSAVAEGYMNAKVLGVAIHGVFLAIIAAGIRYLKFTKKFQPYGILLYSSLLPITYKLFRTDTIGVIKRIEWTFILIILLFFLVKLLVNLITHDKSYRKGTWIPKQNKLDAGL